MADVLGRTYPELFAAVGVHSGLPADAASNLPSALEAMRRGAAPGSASGPSVCAVIVFHGDADTTAHHDNGAAMVNAARSAKSPRRTSRHPCAEPPAIHLLYLCRGRRKCRH